MVKGVECHGSDLKLGWLDNLELLVDGEVDVVPAGTVDLVPSHAPGREVLLANGSDGSSAAR